MSLYEDILDRPSVTEASTGAERRVWDVPVRLFHWSLATAFLVAFVTNRLGIAYFKYHVWAGYTVLVLVAFRIVWGFVGTRHALFRTFVRGPRHVVAYARGLLAGQDETKRQRHYAGHNPLGALMVLALLGGLAAQGALGLFANDDIFNTGPLAGYVTKDVSLVLTSVHRKLFYWLAGAIVLHIAAVIGHHVFKNENLIRAMVTGQKPARVVTPEDAIVSSRIWLATLVMALLCAALAYVVMHAPAIGDDTL